MTPGGLERRIAALERQVAQLAGRAAGGEQLSPNYLSIDPTTGAVSAEFSGRVNAQGINIELADAQNLDDSSIEWIDSMGNIAATIQAWAITSPIIDKIMALQMGPIGGPNAGLQLNETSSSVVAYATSATNQEYSAKVIDSQGSSSFLGQANALPGPHTINFGVVNVVWAATAQYSGENVFPHGLGTIPSAVLLTQAIQASISPYVANLWNVQGPDATNFYVQAGLPAGNAFAAGAEITAFWAAIA